MHCVHLIQLHRGVYSAQGCLFCTRVYILQRGVILHRGVYSVQGCIFCTGVYILRRGVYSAQGCIFGVVYFSRVYILHKGVYSAQGCIFCTGVYILHRSVYSAQGCIFFQGVYSASGCLFCQSIYAAQGSLFCTQSSVKAGRAFTLLPMCNNCWGREFGQEPCTTYPSLYRRTLSTFISYRCKNVQNIKQSQVTEPGGQVCSAASSHVYDRPIIGSSGKLSQHGSAVFVNLLTIIANQFIITLIIIVDRIKWQAFLAFHF